MARRKRPPIWRLFCFETSYRCCHEAPSRKLTTLLFRPDAGRFDDRPPFFDLNFLLCGKRFWTLLVARPGLLSQFDKPLANCRIGQGLHYGGIEFGDDIFWRPLGSPKAVPKR